MPFHGKNMSSILIKNTFSKKFVEKTIKIIMTNANKFFIFSIIIFIYLCYVGVEEIERLGSLIKEADKKCAALEIAWNRSQIPIDVVQMDLRPWKSMWYFTRLTHSFFHAYFTGDPIQLLISAFPSEVKDQYIILKLEFFENKTFKLYGKSSVEGDFEPIKNLGEILSNNPDVVDIIIKYIVKKKFG